MSEIFAVRNVDEKTRTFISEYANEHNLNTGDALRDIVSFAQEHLKEKKQHKKYQSIFKIHDKIKFSGSTTNYKVNE